MIRLLEAVCKAAADKKSDGNNILLFAGSNADDVTSALHTAVRFLLKDQGVFLKNNATEKIKAISKCLDPKIGQKLLLLRALHQVATTTDEGEVPYYFRLQRGANSDYTLECKVTNFS